MQIFFWLVLIKLFSFRSLKELAVILSKFNEQNFIRFYPEVFRPLNAVLECDDKLLPIGIAKMPIGIRIGVGSISFGLKYKFVEYISKSDDEYLQGLKNYYLQITSPLEVRFKKI